MGRKPVPADMRRSVKFQIPLTTSEHARLVEASESSGFPSVSEYVRWQLFNRPLPKRPGRRPPGGGTGAS